MSTGSEWARLGSNQPQHASKLTRRDHLDHRDGRVDPPSVASGFSSVGMIDLRSAERAWSPAEVALLGTIPDVHLAAHLGRTRDDVRRGGTGRVANWKWARALARQRPILLAGGLSAANVAEAIRAVKNGVA